MKPVRKTSNLTPSPLTVALNDLIDRIQRARHATRGGVQHLASSLRLSPNIIHYWRRSLEGSKRTKALVPKEDQALTLARISFEHPPAPELTLLKESKRWLQLCGRWSETPEATQDLQRKLDEANSSMSVDATNTYQSLQKELAGMGLSDTEISTGVSAYFGQASFRMFLAAWQRPMRHVNVFWKADSFAFPANAPDRARNAIHRLFSDLLLPIQGIKADAGLCAGIDVFVSGMTRSHKVRLRDFLNEYYEPAPVGQPGIRYWTADGTVWDDLNIEHMTDAWIFHGPDTLTSPSARLDCMFLVSEISGHMLNTLSRSPQMKFNNPFHFASQVMRHDWKTAVSFLGKRLIGVRSGNVEPNSKLWTPNSDYGNECWVVKPAA